MATLPKVLISRADYQIGGGVALRLRTQGRLIEEALLTVVGPGAIAAAIAAEKEATQRRDQVREALKRDLEAARYATDRAFRQYDAADPPEF